MHNASLRIGTRSRRYRAYRLGKRFADDAARDHRRSVEQRRIGVDIMRKLLAFLFFVSTVALGQSYPSPTYNVLTLQTPLAITSGGTGSATATGSASNLQYLEGGTGAVARTYLSKFKDVVSVTDFGADPTDTADSTTAFNNALAASTYVFVPAGTYKIAGTITLGVSTNHLIGAGRGTTTLLATTANLPMISVSANLTNWSVAHLTLSRTPTATSGGDGIQALSTVGQSLIDDVTVQFQFRGVVLGPTDYSTFQNSVVQNSQSIGVYMSNISTNGACQWQLNNVLSQANGAQGFLLQTIAGPAGVTPGTWTNIASFSNTGTGAAVEGSVVPVNDVRILGGFFGQDANSEIYLDTFGGQHIITGAFVELAGTGATGPTLATPPSGLGSGIEITSNNVDTQITGVHSNANSLDGFYLNGTNETLNASRGTNNGQQGTAGRQNGMNSTAGRVNVTGGILGNTGAGTTQKFGAFAANGTNMAITGVDLTNNATSPYSATSNASSISAIGNLPGATASNIPGSITVQGTITPSQTNGIVGTTAVNNANAGSVGEYLTATGGAVSITSGTTSSPESISLTAGDWDVQAVVLFTGAGTTTFSSVAYTSVSTSATSLGTLGNYVEIPAPTIGGATFAFASPVVRVNVASTTTYFAAVNATFSVSTATATGFLRARRVR